VASDTQEPEEPAECSKSLIYLRFAEINASHVYHQTHA
jgi:hypothetical protein